MQARLVAIALLLAGCSRPSWTVVASNLDRVPLSGVAFAPDDAWAVGGALGSGGDALLTHFDGSQWTETPTGTTATLWWTFGLSSSDLWMVGEEGSIFHWDGATLTSVPSGTSLTLYGIWGTSDGDLWTVGGTPGSTGVILHFDGNAWTPSPAPVAGIAYFKVWGTASDDVFVCGEGGTIARFDGSSWTPMPTGLPPSATLFTIFGRASDDVYAVGGLASGVAVHFDGNAWSPVGDPALAAPSPLAGVSLSPSGTLMIVGSGGTKLHGLAGQLTDDSALAPHDDLHGTFFAGESAFVVGGSYEAPPGAPRSGVIARYGE